MKRCSSPPLHPGQCWDPALSRSRFLHDAVHVIADLGPNYLQQCAGMSRINCLLQSGGCANTWKGSEARSQCHLRAVRWMGTHRGLEIRSRRGFLSFRFCPPGQRATEQAHYRGSSIRCYVAVVCSCASFPCWRVPLTVFAFACFGMTETAIAHICAVHKFNWGTRHAAHCILRHQGSRLRYSSTLTTAVASGPAQRTYNRNRDTGANPRP